MTLGGDPPVPRRRQVTGSPVLEQGPLWVVGGATSVGLTRFNGHLNTWGNPLNEGVHIPRTRPPYPTEFRAEAVRLVKEMGEDTSVEQGMHPTPRAAANDSWKLLPEATLGRT